MEAARSTPRLKRTPIHSAHRKSGARMIEFAGWDMPVQYRGLIDEHNAVRSRAGLFDVSHMGEIELSGPGALEVGQRLMANDVAKAVVGQAQYNLLLNEEGGVVDDLVLYRLAADRILLCVNAANIEKDFRWIIDRGGSEAAIRDVSSDFAQLALQGPRAEEILCRMTSGPVSQLKPFHFVGAPVGEVECLIARTGYTGEDGFELFCDSARGERLWTRVMETGAPLGLEPAGLGARDTLRLEAALPLYGRELDDATTPLEARLEWVVKLTKPTPFIGRDALIRQKSEGLRRYLVGLEMIDSGIARSHYPIFKKGNSIGTVTSGTKSPTLGRSIALGYVAAGEETVDNRVEIEIRGRRAAAKVASLPFYRRLKSAAEKTAKEE
jgi:aminomethyltransferase